MLATRFLLASACALCALPLTAHADGTAVQDQAAETEQRPLVDTIGVRVGGYGFREAVTASGDEPDGTGWDACRMNGLGIYAQHSLSERYFVEAGLDTYFTDSFPMSPERHDYQTPIDRRSGLLSASIGSRFYTKSWISPYVQAGLGAELTQVRLPALQLEDTALLPFGFFGLGANLRVTESIAVGASLRVNAMGYYDDDQFQTRPEPELELATQGQFYAAFRL